MAKPTSTSGKGKAVKGKAVKGNAAVPAKTAAKATAKAVASKPAAAKPVAKKPATTIINTVAAGHGAAGHGGSGHDGGRRDFIHIAAASAAAVGGVAFVWPLVHQMNPSGDTLALSSTEVDLTPIAEGQSITVMWRGRPVFVKHRTQAEIDASKAVALSDLKHPESDEQRAHDKDGTYNPKWLVMEGNCTHLGCVPLGDQGDYKGWFCPCHGSHYDTAGRIRKGPAPLNLPVPEYTFLSDTKIKIG